MMIMFPSYPKVIGIAIIAYIWYYLNSYLYTRLPIHIDSSECDPKFASVVDAFRQNFVDGWESGGASLAVFYDGKKVVDCWGGYADKLAARKWQSDTISLTFSCLKAVASICVALLVDRNRLSYDQPVSQFWPNFGKNGKSDITVQMILSHTQSGLAYLDESLNETAARDHNLMRTIIENERPKWTPGTKTAYHAYMFYWLVDQLIRHSDEGQRGLVQFFVDEIRTRFDVDYSIGLAQEEEHRLARVIAPTFLEIVSELYTTPRLRKIIPLYFQWNKNSMLTNITKNLEWMRTTGLLAVNNPDYHDMLYFGFGNARSMAKLFKTMFTDAVISEETQNAIKTVRTNETDMAIGERFAKGNGFLFYDVNRMKAKHAIGHSGFGCQQVLYDPVNRLAIAYVTNALKIGIYTECRTYVRLQNSIYDALESLNKH